MKQNKHKTRDFKLSIYTSTIGICPEDLLYIDGIKEKKSKSGMLKEIINYYKKYGNASVRKVSGK